ncbi:DUF2312 domain-containing protein [Mesorhizobium sp. M8A.F.Ca.ET.021.01.1.1]|nr:DUF2312 domain-containing protein [Mesorhizobium sp. M8A.F.Ca.ET.021.01.1.1]
MAGSGRGAAARLLAGHAPAGLRASRCRSRRRRDARRRLDRRAGAGRRARPRQAARQAFEPHRGGFRVSTGDITDTTQTVAAGQLRAIIERIERLNEEAKAIGEDKKEIFAEARGSGFDTKAIKTIIRLRTKDQAERQEEEGILQLYMAALGML